MKKQEKKSKLTLLCSLIVLGIGMGTLPVWGESDPGEKLGRGLANTFTGWMEIPDGIADASHETNSFTAVTYGLVEGTGQAITRTATGLYDVVTFLIPDYDKPHLDEEYVY